MLSELKTQLEKNNFIPLHDYMALCNARYYGAEKSIGAEGDFITAPEISQIFGELLGVWVVQRWQDMGKPGHFHLIELGPGRGTLMFDMLHVMRQFPAAFDAAEIHLVENSPRLRGIQKETLTEFGKSMHWHDALHPLPDAPFIVIANEFFDALPIQQIVYSMNGWLERGAVMKNNKLEYATRETTDEFLKSFPKPSTAPVPGSMLEHCPAMHAWLNVFLTRMQSQPGSALIIDYGYTHHDYGDTFQALYHHQFADPLERAGEQDLTAHVNFAAIRDFAARGGLQCAGPITQGEFLKRIGIEIRAQKLLEKITEPADKIGLMEGVHRLTAGEEMGTLFKVICLSSPELPMPEGFHAS